MRRLLYVLIVIALLAIPATAAYAQEPFIVERYADGWWLLGELWDTPDYGDPTFDIWAPFERVDATMTRLDGTGVWPFAWGPVLGTWWMDIGPSVERRMSYAEDYFFADVFGGYYAEFMLPRDEVWFPCSYPLKWKCNYITPTGLEFHSPAAMLYECTTQGLVEVCLAWPWRVDLAVNECGQLGQPCDTISPVVVDIYNSENIFPYGFGYELEIAGMFWKFTDIP